MTQYVKTKADARRVVKAAGYTELYHTSQSGDYPMGSREYYAKPNAATNQWGVPLDQACISRLPGEWAVTIP